MSSKKDKWGRRKSDNQAYPKNTRDKSDLPTMFDKPKSKKYADIVKMDTPENARKAANKLHDEFFGAKTRKKREYVKRVTNLAAQRAGAQLKRENLSAKEVREFRLIKALYTKAYKNMAG